MSETPDSQREEFVRRFEWAHTRKDVEALLRLLDAERARADAAEALVAQAEALAQKYEAQADWYENAEAKNLGQEWDKIERSLELRKAAADLRASLTSPRQR